MKCFKLKCIVEGVDYSEVSYGILVMQEDNSKEYICNISEDSDAVTKFVNELNNHNVESCHINSVIEDFRFDNSSK